ncbi:MAG TPA: zinc ribbon domain-containing protein [Anaerolineae bacterium]|nr:zinc ribbon domain-containing protein [Anaerolineae bacterium]
MPIYEYVCAECGHKFEKLVLSSRRAKKIQCPQCGSLSADKAISVFSGAVTSSSTGSATDCAPSG